MFRSKKCHPSWRCGDISCNRCGPKIQEQRAREKEAKDFAKSLKAWQEETSRQHYREALDDPNLN